MSPDPMADDFPSASKGNLKKDHVETENHSPFRLLSTNEAIADNDNVTAVVLVVFTPDKEHIIAVQHHKRGVDLTAGHADEDDKHFYDTGRRELYEETGATVGHLVPVMLMESDYYESRHCLLYTSPSPRDQRGSRMPSSA